MKRLVLMRGVPGGGKSTKAREIALGYIAMGGQTVAICSTDSFFMKDGEYQWDPSKLGEYHKLNQFKARRHMFLLTELIIIDNTNITRRDMQPYVDAAKEYGYEIHEEVIGAEILCPSMDTNPHDVQDYIALCAQRNTHKVPRDAIERMVRKFESTETKSQGPGRMAPLTLEETSQPKFKVGDECILTLPPNGETLDVVVHEVTQVRDFGTGNGDETQASQGYVVIITKEIETEQGTMVLQTGFEVPEFALTRKRAINERGK